MNRASLMPCLDIENCQSTCGEFPPGPNKWPGGRFFYNFTFKACVLSQHLAGNNHPSYF